MTLTLDTRLRIGIQTIHRRTERADAPWLPRIDELVDLVRLVDDSGYDSLWVGDHISFPLPILDPLLQLAQAAVVSRRLMLGTSVLLLPLRHPTPVAKQVTTLDHLTEGRFILGVGVGGEFPKRICRLRRAAQRARRSAGRGRDGAAEILQRAAGHPSWQILWSVRGRADAARRRASRAGRRSGSPAGRMPALRRIGRLGDGYLAYVDLARDVPRGAGHDRGGGGAGRPRRRSPFGTGHLLFTRLDHTYEEALDRATETLSVRYAMDFRKAAQRYCALGTPQMVAERIREFYAAGVRHVVLDLLGPYEQKAEQIAWFAQEAMPLLADLTAA